MLADVLDRSHSVLEVTGVIQCVEYAENVHAVLRGLLDELINHHVLVVAVTQKVLATQQHLQAGIRHQLAEGTQALPRVLVEEADAGVKSGATPALDTPETSLVEVLTGPNHVLHGHASSHERLVSVAQGDFRDTNLS